MELTLLDILIRVSAMYLVALALMRLTGKPSIGKLSTLDFVVVTMLGDGLDSVIYGEVSILRGVAYFVTITLLHLLVVYLSAQNTLFFRMTSAPPRTLVRKGTLLQDGIRAERMRVETVEFEMRLKGEDQLEEVEEATLETNGKLSVLKNEPSKKAQKQDLKLLREANS